MITPKSSESYTRDDKPNLCVAQIEYRVLNAALEIARRMRKSAISAIESSPQTGIDHEEKIV